MAKKPSEILPNTSFLNLPVPPSWKSADQLNAYESWAYTAINAIAHEVASTEFQLYKKKVVRGEVDYSEIYEHESLSLLDGINPYSNKYNHIFETVVYLELLGEAYWLVMRDAKKRPVSMWQVRPDRVTIIPSETKVIDHYMYRAGSEEFRLEAEDVIPFRFVNPSQPYRGKSPIQSASMAIDTDKFSADWNRKFFYNSALPNMILTTDQNLTQAQVDRLIQVWQNKFQGRDNAHKVAFLTAGFKPAVIGQTIRDMDFAEQRRAMRDEILGIFKVPKTVIGLTDDVNRANAEATNSAFIQRTVNPIVTMMVNCLNEFYLKMWDDDTLFFDFIDRSPENTEAKLALYDNGLRNGWMTINEVREKENLDPVEGGDVVRLPFGMTPIGEEAPVPADTGDMEDDDNTDDDTDTDVQDDKAIVLPVIKSDKKKKQKFNVSVPHKTLSVLREEEVTQEINKSLLKLVQMAMQDNHKPKLQKELVADYKETYWKQMVEKTDAQELEMRTRLNRLLEDQEREVLEKVSNMKDVKRLTIKATNDLIFNDREWEDKFKKEFAKYIKTIVEEKALSVMAQVGAKNSLDLTTQESIKYLGKEGLAFAKSVNQTTKDLLIKQLQEGLRQGEGTNDIAKRVRSVYKDATEFRSQLIARTEILRSTNFATTVAYEQSGTVEGKEWLTALDERTCPSCGVLDGMKVETGGVFKSAEFGSVKFPPLHPQCRCTTMPIIDKSDVDVGFSNPQRAYDAFDWNGIEEESQKTINRNVADRFDTTFGNLAGFTEAFNWKVELLDINKIDIWSAMDEDKVKKYMDALKRGDRFPPLLAIARDAERDALDGAHRMEALKRLGVGKLYVLVGRQK